MKINFFPRDYFDDNFDIYYMISCSMNAQIIFDEKQHQFSKE